MTTGTVNFGKKYYLFLIVFLGMLSAFGPFVTDMYLPTLPSMAAIFHTTPSQVQMGLATSMLGLAVGQVSQRQVWTPPGADVRDGALCRLDGGQHLLAHD